MVGTIYRTLLIEDNDDDVFLMKEMISDGRSSLGTDAVINLVVVPTLAEAYKKLETERFDIVISDLSLADSKGFDTVLRLKETSNELPVIVLTGYDDTRTAIIAIEHGIQDYLVKGRFNAELMLRSILYSIERFKLLGVLKSLALIDDMTGLYNRRGFVMLAESQMKLAQRRERKLVMMFVDLDKMKQINDNYGHKEGDRALIETASILRAVFRGTDIIGRMGGDEFAVLAVEATEDSIELLEKRMEDAILQSNQASSKPYELSLSYGCIVVDPSARERLDAVLERADSLMYEMKRGKRGGNPPR
jgi:diguanylate cyclase (GGDEF)-like protein